MLIEADDIKNKSPQSQNFEEAIELFYSNWIWRSVHALLDHQDFDSSLNWLARKLNVTTNEIVEAIEGLKILGLADYNNGKIIAKQIQFLIPPEKNNYDTRLKAHKNLSIQLINRMNKLTEASGRTLITTSSRELIEAAKKEIIKILQKLNADSVGVKKDGLFAISVNLVNLAPNNSAEIKKDLK